LAITNGERGHYEIAAGHDPAPYLRALENFAQGIGLIPEQIWDAPDMPSHFFHFGGPTDAAVPLV
jgi:glucoamylase